MPRFCWQQQHICFVFAGQRVAAPSSNGTGSQAQSKDSTATDYYNCYNCYDPPGLISSTVSLDATLMVLAVPELILVPRLLLNGL